LACAIAEIQLLVFLVI